MGAASASAGRMTRNHESMRMWSSSSGSGLQGYADHVGQRRRQRGVGRDQGIAGGDRVAGEEIVAPAARFVHEDDAGGAVPRVDMELAIRFAAAGRYVDEAERARASPAHGGAGA